MTLPEHQNSVKAGLASDVQFASAHLEDQPFLDISLHRPSLLMRSVKLVLRGIFFFIMVVLIMIVSVLGAGLMSWISDR